MALTSGAKKGLITILTAAILVGGGLYFQKHKVSSKPNSFTTEPKVETSIPAQALTVPVASEPAPVVISEQSVAPAKKQPVARATVKKSRPSPVSRGAYRQEPTHETVRKELTSDQKALQGLAGDKL